MSSSISGIWRSGGNWFWALLEAPSFCNIDGAFLLPSVRWLEKSVICLNCEFDFFFFLPEHSQWVSQNIKGHFEWCKASASRCCYPAREDAFNEFCSRSSWLSVSTFCAESKCVVVIPHKDSSSRFCSSSLGCLLVLVYRMVSSVVLYPCMRTRDGSPSLLCDCLIPSHTHAHWQCPYSLAVT